MEALTQSVSIALQLSAIAAKRMSFGRSKASMSAKSYPFRKAGMGMRVKPEANVVKGLSHGMSDAMVFDLHPRRRRVMTSLANPRSDILHGLPRGSAHAYVIPIRPPYRPQRHNRLSLQETLCHRIRSVRIERLSTRHRVGTFQLRCISFRSKLQLWTLGRSSFSVRER